MSRSFVPAVTALSAIALCVGPAQAQITAQDSAVGAGSSGDDVFPSFQFNVTSGPAGENPSGEVSLDLLGGIHASGPVTCVAVSGKRADIGFPYQDFGTALRLVLEVEDLGPPGSGLDTIDLHVFDPSERTGTDCSPIPETLQRQVRSGDISVHDAHPLPTSKDQCKNGGWRNYSVFKNQGDCVSFVRHKARQECVFIRAAHGRPAFRAQYGSGAYKRHAMRGCVRARMND